MLLLCEKRITMYHNYPEFLNIVYKMHSINQASLLLQMLILIWLEKEL